MALEHSIDHERRLVILRAHGTFTDEEAFRYKREVWSRPNVAGYDELVDMSEVERIALPSVDRVGELAGVSAWMDAPALPSKLAIVAPDDLSFGLARMYQAYRALDVRSSKQVAVFRSREEADAWLGLRDPSSDHGSA